MRATNMNKTISMARLLLATVVALWLAAAAHATAPGMTATDGTPGTFNLTAQAAYISQPDGQAVYSWGYGCVTGSTPAFLPTTLSITPFCSQMQVPGPTLIVTEGTTVTVNLTNNLPTAAGNTSIIFSGFTLTSVSGGVAGLITQEAAPSGTVQYKFVASTPGTHAYYSGTQGDLQVEMGLYGAIIVLPSSVPGSCASGSTGSTGVGFAGGNGTAESNWSESDYRLAAAAYDNAKTCYDREYLFQFSEMDPTIHKKAEQQVAAAAAACVANGAGSAGCSLEVPTEPYHPSYFLINGRSMPDDMDPNYAMEYPHQPYNGDPHMHPGEQVLIRVIGQGRWQHPFHEHGNHVRILGRDGNLILAPDGSSLAGPLLFTTTTTPGLAFDGIFYWTGKGLNWDAYGHKPTSSTNDPNATLTCSPDANGYNTGDPTALNYYEWCQDHNKPLEVAPFGDVASGGPATLPDPNLFTNGPWYSGSPYLGPDATSRATAGTCTGSNNTTSCSTTGTTPPSGTIANSPSGEAGYAFMWHSHNEREITTNNIFPGGMLMMMLVDSREFVIDETN
jgi:FtsP/CotA-like multicopper oxidase with cupredoxin domain